MTRHPAPIHALPPAAAGARPMAGSPGARASLIVELASNAPAVIRAAAPLAAVELVRVRAMTLPRGEPIRIRGAFVAWNAPASAWRRYERAAVAFAASLDAARAVALVDGGRL